jgi:hypothetical protein
LLLMVTFGIYYPWAKVRRLRYFYGNTVVGGEPLGFHADPTKLLKGYLLVGLLFMLYSAAGKFSATAGFIAFLIVAALWPALLKSSMQFRMANTSWRGLRFRFKGSLPGAYRAVLPLFVPGLVILAALTQVADPEKPPTWYLKVLGVVLLASMVVAPWLLWNLKQYQHNHYALASLQTTFKATLGSFYALFFKIIGVTVLPLLVPAGVAGAMLYAMKTSGTLTPSSTGRHHDRRVRSLCRHDGHDDRGQTLCHSPLPGPGVDAHRQCVLALHQPPALQVAAVGDAEKLVPDRAHAGALLAIRGGGTGPHQASGRDGEDTGEPGHPDRHGGRC